MKLDSSALTVVLTHLPEKDTPEYKLLCDNIWETHKENKKLFGSRVTGISWGDLMKENHELESIIGTLVEMFGDHLDEYRHKELIEKLESRGLLYE